MPGIVWPNSRTWSSSAVLTPLILIDEAHLLSPAMLEEIRFLTNFHMDSASPMALCLVGQPELRNKLRLRAFEAVSR